MARQILTGLWLSVLTCGVALAGDGSGLCGGYLGQDPPGMQPALFAPGVVSTDLGMYGTVVFTPDLTEAYWVADNSPELWWSRIENGCWTKPEVLPIKPGYRINSPVLSADGTKLYFLAAERGPGGIDRNDQIWCADRTVRGWSQPVCLPKEVNGVSKHFQFSVDADGNIYFGGGGADLYVARRVGAGYAPAAPLEGPINTDDAEVDPCLSPSGDILVFTRFSRRGVELLASFRSEAGAWGEPVSLREALGGGTGDSGARFSPDGKYLFFQSQREGSAPDRSVYWVEAGVLSPLGGQPAVTPVPGRGDGVITFYSHRDGNIEIYTMCADGSDQRRLTFNKYDDSSPALSPDGSRIAFISDRDDPNSGACKHSCFYQLYVMNVDGSGEHKLVETVSSSHHPDWSPDGTKITFDSESNLQGNVYVVNADGSDLHLLIEDGYWADWSPDGTRIVFASKRDGNVELYLADADGKNQHRLTRTSWLEYFPDWSPDGLRIAFAVLQERAVHVMDADGGNDQRLTRQGNAEDPTWSPDGTWISYQSSNDGDFEIYAINVAEALRGKSSLTPVQLTENQVGDLWPSWGVGRACRSRRPAAPTP